MFIMPVVWFLVIFFVGQCFIGSLLSAFKWIGVLGGMFIAWSIICFLLYIFIGEDALSAYGVFGLIGFGISAYWVSE